MKEHKNPKVLSEGILWMVSAVEDFGVSYIKMKVLLYFLLQSRLLVSLSCFVFSNFSAACNIEKIVSPSCRI